jgi:hypothetical protein
MSAQRNSDPQRPFVPVHVRTEGGGGVLLPEKGGREYGPVLVLVIRTTIARLTDRTTRLFPLSVVSSSQSNKIGNLQICIHLERKNPSIVSTENLQLWLIRLETDRLLPDHDKGSF